MISRPLLPSSPQPHLRISLAEQQRGVVLLVSLLFLIVLTLLGIAASRMVTSEERQSRYLREYNTAFQAAESAMRDARDDIDGLIATTPPSALDLTRLLKWGPTPDCQFGFCTYDRTESTRPWTVATNWANATQYGTYSLRSPLPQSAVVGTAAGSGKDADGNNVARFSTNTTISAVTGVSRQPVYLIEAIDTGKGSAKFGEPAPITYRVTALGYGADPNTRAMVQEIACNALACAGFVK
jgi:type IV pilus assembly protein PilX